MLNARESTQSPARCRSISGPSSSCTNGCSSTSLQAHLRQQRNHALHQRASGRALNHHGQLHRRRRHLHRRLRALILRAVHNVRPVDQFRQRRHVHAELRARDMRDPAGAATCSSDRKTCRIASGPAVPSVSARSKLRLILRRQERAQMMIEPPRHARRRRVLEVDDRVLVRLEPALVKQRPARCISPWYANARRADAFAMKAREQRGRTRPIKAFIVIKNAAVQTSHGLPARVFSIDERWNVSRAHVSSNRPDRHERPAPQTSPAALNPPLPPILSSSAPTACAPAGHAHLRLHPPEPFAVLIACAIAAPGAAAAGEQLEMTPLHSTLRRGSVATSPCHLDHVAHREAPRRRLRPRPQARRSPTSSPAWLGESPFSPYSSSSLWSTGHLVFDARLLSALTAVHYAASWLAGFVVVALLEEYLTRGYLQFTLTRGLAGIYTWLPSRLRTPKPSASGPPRSCSPCLRSWTPAPIPANRPSAYSRGPRRPRVLPEPLAHRLAVVGHRLPRRLGLGRNPSSMASPTGGVMVQHHLLATHPVGAPLLSGGTTGPEGSIFVLPVMVCITLVIA